MSNEQKRIIIYPGSHGQDAEELMASIKQAAERAGMSISGWARDRLKKQARRETRE